MLEALSRGLRAAGLEVSVQELQDILWLAERLPLVEPSPDDRPIALAEPQQAPAPPAAKDDESRADDDIARIDPRAPGPARLVPTALHARTLTGTVSASTLRVPGVASSDCPDDLRRALQPFARRVPSPWRTVLDEEATAEHAADTGVWSPVCRAVRERWFDLRLVIEDSPSMALWTDTLREFERLLRNQGGFRSVVSYRWSDTKGEAVSTLDGRRRVPIERLVDRNRPQLVLLVTDGTSARWRNGAAQSLLCGVGCHAAVSIVNMLPARAWRHSAVGEPEIALYGERAGDSNARMKALLPWWLDDADMRESVGVPVVGLDAATLKRWARTMTARGGASVPAVMVARGQRATSPGQAPAPMVDAVERVARYRSMVSREAYDLAVFLSVPDPLTVPVMRLVQRTMLPATGTAELAEFFVGGLLEREDLGPDAAEPAYRLAAGVREALMKSLRYSEEGRINEQLRSVGRFLENASQSDQSFDAYFPSPGGSQRLTEWSLPFASVSKAVLSGELVREAEPVAAAEPVQRQAEPEREASAEAVGHPKRLVYMAYSRNNRAHVESFRRVFGETVALRPELELSKDDIYLDFGEHPAGEDWQSQAREALGRCAVMVFMVSPRSLDSSACMAEVGMAHGMGVPIVPVLMEPCDWDQRPIPGDPDRRRLNTFFALPRSPNGRLRPVNQWKDSDDAMRSVVADLLADWPPGSRVRHDAPAETAPKPELRRRIRALAEACMAVPNRGFPSGVQTAVWFGSSVALTWALRRSSLAELWKDPDHGALPYDVFDVWAEFLGVERRSGNVHPVADERLMHVSTIESGGRNAAHQLLALAQDDSSAASRGEHKVMPLLASSAAIQAGSACELLYFVGDELVHDTAVLMVGSLADTLYLEAGDETQTWPLPPEAMGAAVMVGDACCGVVFDVGDAKNEVRVKSSGVIRDALRAQWVVRLHRGIESHHEWVRSEASSGTRLRLDGADLTGVKLEFTNLSGASLQAARFSGANLEGSQFDGAKLQRAHFDGAILQSATFVGADLTGANFEQAVLIDVNFGGAAMRGAQFERARIAGCIWENAQLDEGVLDQLLREDPNAHAEEAVEPTRTRIAVHAASLLFSKMQPEVSAARWGFVAAGDSWFSGNECLLHHLSFQDRAIAWRCEMPPASPIRMAQVAASPELHSLLKSSHWSGLLLSVGGDDVFDAVRTPAVGTDGSSIPPDRRLLLTQAEWGPMENGAFRYISGEGMDTLGEYLRANFDRLVQARDAGPSRGQPIFIHGYPAPIPRPAGLPGSHGPWLQPSFAAYGIPIEHHAGTAAALMKLLSDMLHGIAGDTSRCPNVHFFDASSVKLAPASANWTGTSGDWATEVHPAPEGYRKIADAWSAQIEAVLRRGAQATA